MTYWKHYKFLKNSIWSIKSVRALEICNIMETFCNQIYRNAIILAYAELHRFEFPTFEWDNLFNLLAICQVDSEVETNSKATFETIKNIKIKKITVPSL